MSYVTTQFKAFLFLTIPTLGIFAVLLAVFFNYRTWVSDWLVGVPWLSYATLALVGLVAAQFGKSRLVLASFILIAFLAVPHLKLPFYTAQSHFYWAVLSALFLMFYRDRGLSIRNLLLPVGVLTILALLVLFVPSYLANGSIPTLDQVRATAGEMLAQRVESVSPDLFLFAFTALSIAWVRLLFRVDHTQNALFLLLISLFLIEVSPDPLVDVPIVLIVSALTFYAVLRDSFTMAFRDELTGIPSRRAMMQYVQTLGRKYSVVMSDIDHFKQFNDTYGHDVGDEVLKLVASKLARVRSGGKAFRYGGEEFVLIFPRKTPDQIKSTVESVRQTIEDYEIVLRVKPRPAKAKKNRSSNKAQRTKTQTVKVTSSFGIAQRKGADLSFEQVMKQADVALYKAKKAGRNCVKIAKQ